MNYKNKILLNKNTVILKRENTDNIADVKVIAMLVEELEDLGYSLSDVELLKLAKSSTEDLTVFYKETTDLLKEFKGVNVNHKMLYPGFPLVEDNCVSSFMDAMIYYITGRLPGEYPDGSDEASEELERPVLHEFVDLEPLKIVGEDEASIIIDDYFRSLLKGATSWSDDQKNLFLDYIKENPDLEISVIPSNKENLCWLASETPVNLDSVLKTATDILRYITALSDGDITLANNTKYCKMPRDMRRKILRLIDRLPVSALEDMYKYRSRWIRISEFLHPGDYASTYPNAYNLITKLRNKEDKDLCFMSKYEKAYAEKDYIKCANLLSKRPGEFARKLDALIRNANNPDDILDIFSKPGVGESVALPVLLQLREHFLGRTEVNPKRNFVIKGSLVKNATVENTILPLNKNVVDSVVDHVETSIKGNIALKEFELTTEDKIFIMPEMFDIMMPDNSMRSVSASKKALTRGSRIKVEDGKCLRFFTHWRNIDSGYNGRVDIDLAANIFSEDGKHLHEFSWRDRNSNRFRGALAFSGDITDAPEGASEFIDVDLNALNIKDARYIMITNNIYTCQDGFNEIPECFSGVMIREELASGEVFEPKTVKTMAELTAENCNFAASFVYDIKEKTLIWVDSNLEHRSHVAGDSTDPMFNTVKRLLNPNKISVGQMYKWYAEVNNIELVESLEDATFVVGKDVTKFDIEKFSGLL